jgi:hypothetical protein
MYSQYVAEVERLLEYLQEDEPLEAIETTLERINRLTDQHIEVSTFLVDEYFKHLVEENPSGTAFLSRFIQALRAGAHYSLAFYTSCALAKLWKTQASEKFAMQLLELIVDYKMEDRTEILIQAAICKITLKSSVFISIPYINIPCALRPDLLKMALSQAFFRYKTFDGQFVDFQQRAQRANHILSLFVNLNEAIKVSRQYLEPFLLNEIRYRNEVAVALFDQEMSLREYETAMLNVYGIPLLPMLKRENIQFVGLDKIVFGNFGYGSLPSSSVKIDVDGQEIEVGDLIQDVFAEQEAEIYIEDQDIFYDFLRRQKKSSIINVVFDFQKFGRSYSLIIPTVSVGHLIEKVNRNTVEMVLPYELLFHGLSDKEFERLCYWIVGEDVEGRFGEVLWLNEDGGSERGRDVLAVELATNRKFAFQCKRVEKFHPSDIEEELTTFEGYVNTDPDIRPDVYILFVSAAITDMTKTKGDELARRVGMDIQYWPKSTIDRLVRRNKVIQDRFWRIVQQRNDT